MGESLADVTVVIPVRNAAENLPGCLDAVTREMPAEVIVVDGESADASREVALGFDVRLLSDGGGGLPLARTMGVEAAATKYVALVDSDVVFPPGGLADLLEEFLDDQYDSLQAGIEPVAAAGYWSEALAVHERWGRRRYKFGIAATLITRELMLDVGFDHHFPSGEDIDLRYRLSAAGKRIGVSSRTVVAHRYSDPSFEFARRQFEEDGRGLGRMVRHHGWRALPLLLLPAAAAVRGMGLSLVRRQPRWVRYYATFCVFNYRAMAQGLVERQKRSS